MRARTIAYTPLGIVGASENCSDGTVYVRLGIEDTIGCIREESKFIEFAS